MKKVIILLVLAATFSVNSYAQTDALTAKKPKTEAPVAQKQESWKNLLGLSKEQDMKMKEFGATYKEQSETLRADESLDKKVKQAKLKELQAANEANMKSFMTSEQFEKYLVIKKERADAKKAQQAAGNTTN